MNLVDWLAENKNKIKVNLKEIGNFWGIRKQYNIRKRLFKLFKIEVWFYMKSDDGFGRFGGGWSWKLGFQANKKFSSIIFNLFVFDVWIKIVR